jgi:hypothetical protein
MALAASGCKTVAEPRHPAMDRRTPHLLPAARARLGLPLAVIALAWSVDARARCAIEKPALALSYPDASTVAVPPDAVFWLVPKLGSVQVRLDGAELLPLGSSPAERFQFEPAQPLARGEHELDVRISPVIAGDDSAPEDVQIRFTVADLPYRAGDVEPLEARRFAAPGPERPASCRQNTLLAGWCDDIARPAYDVLSFAPIGEPLFYVVDGHQLVAVGCEQALAGVWDVESVVRHEIAAVVPTGVSEARLLEAGPSFEDAGGGAASGCTLQEAAQQPSSQRWIIVAALGAVVLRRPRRAAR